MMWFIVVIQSIVLRNKLLQFVFEESLYVLVSLESSFVTEFLMKWTSSIAFIFLNPLSVDATYYTVLVYIHYNEQNVIN